MSLVSGGRTTVAVGARRSPLAQFTCLVGPPRRRKRARRHGL